ncbi:MAG: phosphatidate cytidylyltransferase [Alphaproteobacteria bacterium]|nr:phosphatidate cytidylyltransferase [Alphaproteobacteria bacterium]MBU2379444.1 phosphatidate cytidylyltransferase [Alphaproteobacteria bacterium]
MAVKGRDIGLRAASAVVLAPAAVLATWAGGPWFLALLIGASGLLATEWAMMSAPGAWRATGAAVFLALLAAIATAYVEQLSLALVLLVFGAAVAALYARARGQEGLDAAYGVLYLGWPAVLVIWLRDGHSPEGLNWTVFALSVTWAADIAAYLFGSLIGGPKLWPRFSPNKTWSGFAGGLLAGVVAGAVIAGWLDMGRLTVPWGALLGLAGALATMAGDLWESALKRRFGVKDAGKLIPGHGGLLDRVDGLMFAIVVVAAGHLGVLMLDGGG